MHFDAASRSPLLPLLRQTLRRGVLLVTLVGFTAAAGGQEADAASGPTPAQMTADLLANLALDALSTTTGAADVDPGVAEADAVRPDQYIRAEVLLDLALEQAPQDAELWRLRAEVAKRLSDAAGQSAALRRYVELRPGDDAVRLQVILTELTELETLDGRLALLEGYLNDPNLPGRTPALVSRLSSAAAATARALGDDARFVKHLRVAGRQNAANAEAAGLTLAFAESRQAKPEQIAAAAVNLVRADPVNPASRRVLAARLSAVTAYTRAAQQYKVSTQLPDAGPLNDVELAGWVRALIGAGDLEQASAQLAAWEAFTLGDDAAGSKTEDAPLPPAQVVLLRRVLDGEQGKGPAAFERVASALRPAAQAGNDSAALELAWITAIFGSDTQPVAELLRDKDAQDVRYLRASGFVYMREGAVDWARRAFEQVADQDAISAFGLAHINGRDDAGIARQLRQVAANFPDTFGAAMAHCRLHKERRDVTVSSAGRGVLNVMNRLPPTLWAFDVDRNPWVGVQANMVKSRNSQLEPVNAQVKLKNLTNIALPLGGPDPATAGPTAVVSVSTYASGRPTGSAPAIVADLGRRLVLMPGEQVDYDLRLDRSGFGLGLVRAYPSSVTFNGTFIVGPQIGDGGGFTTGPLGGIDSVRSAQVLIESANPENISKWITLLGEPRDPLAVDDRTYFAALSRAGTVYPQLQKAGLDPAVSQGVVAGINKAFDQGGAELRAFCLMTLGGDADSNSPFGTLFDMAVRSDADVVRVAHLAVHVSDPLDPALVSAIRDGGPRLQRFAKALTEALKQPSGPQGAR